MEDETTSFDVTRRQTINPLVDEINKQTEPLLKDAVKEFGEPVSLSFRLYNQVRFYEEFGKLRLGTSVASKKQLAEQFGVSEKSIESAFNNLTNKKKLGKWVQHDEPVFRNVTRTWMSNVRIKRGVNSYRRRAELLPQESTTLTAGELVTDKPPLSESKMKVRESNTLSNDKGLKAEDYGLVSINIMFDYWTEKVGYEITSRRQANRNACNNLYKRHGEEKLKQLVNGVSKAQSEPYAPRIVDYVDLQSNLNKLLAWGRAQLATQNTIKSFGEKK